MNKPVAWMYAVNGIWTAFSDELPPDDAYDEGTLTPLYIHPAKELKKAVEIIKDFQSDDVPPCKYYEDTYADGWMDACNEILWAIEDELNGKAQEK